MSCKACRTLPPIIAQDYTPKGTYKTLAGLRTYITGPVTATTGLIVLYDIFGLAVQTLQGADLLAARLGCLVTIPDFFEGVYAQPGWFPADTEEKQSKLASFVANQASYPRNVDALLDVVRRYEGDVPGVEKWGALGLCWGGKVAVLASGPGSPFVATGQVHPGRADAADAENLAVPHLVLASKDEPADAIRAYAEVIGKNGIGGYVETYSTMWHGWMGARAILDVDESLAEYRRGYTQAAEFFENTPSILLVGTGSVGGVHLLQLQRAGCAVTAVCRSSYDVIKQKGFTLTSYRLGSATYKPDHLVRSVAECPRDSYYDYVIVTTKCFPGSTPALAELLRPALDGRPGTTIVLAQNGIEIEQGIADAFPQNPLLSAVVYIVARQTAPGIIDNPEKQNLVELGTYPADAPSAHKDSARRLAGLFVRGGGDATVHDDIQVARWSKLLFLRSSEFADGLVWGIMMEVVALARRIGVPGVDECVAKKRFAIAKARVRAGTGNEPSMLQDVKHGRLFEVEAIVGNTVRLGRRWGVAMPRLETVYALAKGRYDRMLKNRA
ncbi:2-dehydropantoate 2-reductase [Aspergillus avenaceus]|uniref:2-dehydropantoate 2-reductase n=1 Tax=Aspergillus avenaceus TaxID=36643 RepID=A0A5N6U0V6_ASPAV|nr:2-dehydropantoate 2-reductase [Aspergillus avenaceus]